jgi:hypothetical protein
MRTLRLSAYLLAATVFAGCKTSPDEALVVFDVTVAADVPTYAAVRFSVVTPAAFRIATRPQSARADVSLRLLHGHDRQT